MKFNRSTSLTVFIAAAAIFAAAAGLAQDERRKEEKPKTLTLDVYALETCPISGRKLGDDAVVKKIDGREVRFCCRGCAGAFEDEKEKYFKEIDEKLIKQQKPHYPLEKCVVAGRALEDAEDPQDVIHQGRLVRLCCPRCVERFKNDPDRYIAKLDEAIIKQQRESYPLKNCVIGGPLGSMGKPAEVIVGGTLVRFCCAGCESGFKKNPAKHLATIHEAWKKKHEDAEKKD